MTIKTLGKCEWDEIAVDEVFAHFGCLEIAYKFSKKSVILLASNTNKTFSYCGKVSKKVYSKFRCFSYPLYDSMVRAGELGKLHKLPKSFQRCFIEWEK